MRGALLASLLEAHDEEAQLAFLTFFPDATADTPRALAADRRAASLAGWLPTLLRQGSPRRRRAAALGLGALRVGAWGEALPALADPVAEVRAAAAAPLAEHPDPGAARARAHALTDDPDPAVRAAARGRAGGAYQRV